MVKTKNPKPINSVADNKELLDNMANSMKLFIIEFKRGLQKFDDELGKIFDNSLSKAEPLFNKMITPIPEVTKHNVKKSTTKKPKRKPQPKRANKKNKV